ncbi:MAG TPA: HAD-IA family hydrolase [Mesorhizobium sp.]|jgi:2-haloacid dehalogenase|uniref:HAD-IA family hydrolase n=1 Tax=Mesorhizobium sp. TaxID=1871066 RepID=UPI002DDD9478|nr:HAD-IA family hydrolase [Mesorhizobium sp.]HEV2501809.1 HAD-IA family hydrolase [Mesorhizobium sp.]
MAFVSPAALVFDAGGTVFDWRTPIVEALRRSFPELSSAAFVEIAQDCRGRFLALNGAVIRGDRAWMGADAVFAEAIDASLESSGLQPPAAGDDIRYAWRRMPAWEGAADAIATLRKRWAVAPLTVLSLPMILGSSREAGVVWDCVFSCDLLGIYKPDPRCFSQTTDLLAVDKADIMMVASHPSDLRAARDAGWRTGYIRATLFDPDDDYEDRGFGREFDLVVDDFAELVTKMCA